MCTANCELTNPEKRIGMRATVRSLASQLTAASHNCPAVVGRPFYPAQLIRSIIIFMFIMVLIINKQSEVSVINLLLYYTLDATG